ncbi:MAG: response regulator transcription factor [Chthoniobacteraceae bacterium]
MRISSELLSRLSSAILRLYSPSLPKDVPENFLRAVRGLLGCENMSYTEFGKNHYSYLLEPKIGPEISPAIQEAFGTYAAQHPSISYIRQTKSREAVKISDFLSATEWYRTDLYNEFFKKLGIRHQLGFMFTQEGVEIGFAANRNRQDFSDVHRFLLKALMDHLSQAIQNANAMERVHRAMDSQGNGGTVVFDSTGIILFCSQKAAECLARFFGPVVVNRLPDELYRRIKTALEKPSPDILSPRALQPLTKEGENSSLVVRLMPNHQINEHILVLEEHVETLSLSIFKEHGLTEREAEVLKWVTLGKTNPEIAIILGISVKTVGHHIEHIMSKLGVERRGGAALWAQQTLRICNA